MEPLWKKIETTKDGKLWTEARKLAVYINDKSDSASNGRRGWAANASTLYLPR